jgi:hypothetical protein
MRKETVVYDRSISHAHSRVLGRRVVRQIHWRAMVIPVDWISAHRAARIDARCAVARERHIQKMQGRGGRCGL